MGSSNTRPKLTQVVPSHGPVEGRSSRGERGIGHATSGWTVEPFQSPAGEQQGTLGRRRTTQLPPLRQEVPLTFSPLTAGSTPQSHSAMVGHSIIQSHPPRRLQALQPLAPATSGILLDVASNREVPGAGTGARRSGAAHRSSTRGQGGRCGTSSLLQGGVLEAQVVLGRQTHSQRRAHRRRVRELQDQREKRRQARTVFTGSADGGDDGNGMQRVHLVKRPAQRDIFWDASSEEGLDLGDLSRGSPGSLERDRGRAPPTESHNASGFEELGELGQDDPRLLSQRERAGAPETGERGDAERLAEPGARVSEKRLPWMLGWEGVEHGGQSLRRESGNGDEVLEWDRRSGRASSTGQGERVDPGKNGSSKSEEEWEFGPRTGEGRRQRGQLTRTKLDLIPSFQNQLYLDSEM